MYTISLNIRNLLCGNVGRGLVLDSDPVFAKWRFALTLELRPGTNSIGQGMVQNPSPSPFRYACSVYVEKLHFYVLLVQS